MSKADMDAEWSVAAGEHDPVIIVPWADPSANGSGALRFFDLRTNPALVDNLVEATAYPELRAALLQLNAQDGPVWSAKCDVWELSEEERQLDFETPASGIGLYLDLFPADATIFSSFEAQLAGMQKLTEWLGALPASPARVECILRPAFWNNRECWATTVYVYGYGENRQMARAHWARALQAVTEVIVHEGGEPTRAARRGLTLE